jgi:hypothetical protein
VIVAPSDRRLSPESTTPCVKLSLRRAGAAEVERYEHIYLKVVDITVSMDGAPCHGRRRSFHPHPPYPLSVVLHTNQTGDVGMRRRRRLGTGELVDRVAQRSAASRRSVRLGLGRIITLYHRSFTSYQIH